MTTQLEESFWVMPVLFAFLPEAVEPCLNFKNCKICSEREDKRSSWSWELLLIEIDIIALSLEQECELKFNCTFLT